MFGPPKGIFFDLDGTLVRSLPHVIQTMQTIIRELVGRNVSQEELVAAFGPPPQNVLNVFVPEHQQHKAWELWDQALVTLKREQCEPFDGIDELLQTLKSQGLPMGIVTGRDRGSAKQILKAVGWWGHYFEESNLIAGDDEWGAKPDPRGLSELCKRFGLTPKNVVYVGDHSVDAQAALGAGVLFAAALWDLDPKAKTHRTAYKKLWTHWDEVDAQFQVTLRLPKPSSLIQWLVLSHSQTT
jgi:HAD superfamily hydrolase (TIGR01549 family)